MLQRLSILQAATMVEITLQAGNFNFWADHPLASLRYLMILSAGPQPFQSLLLGGGQFPYKSFFASIPLNYAQKIPKTSMG